MRNPQPVPHRAVTPLRAGLSPHKQQRFVCSPRQAPLSLWRVGMDFKHSREPKAVLKVDLWGWGWQGPAGSESQGCNCGPGGCWVRLEQPGSGSAPTAPPNTRTSAGASPCTGWSHLWALPVTSHSSSSILATTEGMTWSSRCPASILYFQIEPWV